MSDDLLWFSTGRHRPRTDAWGPDLHLRLQRYVGDTGRSGGTRKAVLLLHGASACHRSFTVPGVGLAQFLYGTGIFDPWLLDWRGSHLVVDDDRNRDYLRAHTQLFNFNRAAMEDLPAAIKEMRKRGVAGPISLLGHCMGSTTIAEAVALGHVTTSDVDCIVLSTLGLFYEAPLDSRLKSEERVLERLMPGPAERASLPAIDPRVSDNGKARFRSEWPAEFNNLYDTWPRALRPHDEDIDAVPPSPVHEHGVDALCNRLSFMYGVPYEHRKLAHEIHGGPSIPPQLPHQFGAIPLAMYWNAARNLRAGYATLFDEEIRKSIERSRPGGGVVSDTELISDAARLRFRELKVTLVTGGLNRLWHRDSIDRMYEWLCQGSSRGLRKIRKHIFPDYAHQDLWWGRDSPKEVYPSIVKALVAETTADSETASAH